MTTRRTSYPAVSPTGRISSDSLSYTHLYLPLQAEYLFLMQLHLPVRVVTQASAGAMSQYRHDEWLQWHVSSSPSPHLNYQLPITTVFSRAVTPPLPTLRPPLRNPQTWKSYFLGSPRGRARQGSVGPLGLLLASLNKGGSKRERTPGPTGLQL